MNANPILLQKKYSRVIEKFAEKCSVTLDTALRFFYQSETAQMIREGVSDLHCMSDDYLVEELEAEFFEQNRDFTNQV